MPTDAELRPLATAMLKHSDYAGSALETKADVLIVGDRVLKNRYGATDEKACYSIIAGARYAPPSLEERLAAANHTIAENQAQLDERDELRARNSRLAKWRVVLAISSLALFASCWIQWRISQ
jgi:hypothetical protein